MGMLEVGEVLVYCLQYLGMLPRDPNIEFVYFSCSHYNSQEMLSFDLVKGNLTHTHRSVDVPFCPPLLSLCMLAREGVCACQSGLFPSFG